MEQDRLIGRVVKVRTYQALIELLPETRSYVKASCGGLYPVAAINSYVILPIGSERVVALVTSLDMAEEQEANFSGRQMLVLPQTRRTMWVSMVGRIVQEVHSDAREFQFGIRRYPELDNPVWFASEGDLDVIFELKCQDDEKRKRLISIGHSPLFPDYEVQIDMDAFFGKHAAILGNTGSGKSCTVTAVINAVMKRTMPHAHFVIFDTNAEYEAAFTRVGEDGKPEPLHNRLVISNDGYEPSGFWLPHWFMDGRDYTAFFRPGDGAQGPLLARAITAARSDAQPPSGRLMLLEEMEWGVHQIKGSLDNPPQGNAAFAGLQRVREHVQSLISLLEKRRPEYEEHGLLQSWDCYMQLLRRMAKNSEGEKASPLLAATRSVLKPDVLSLYKAVVADMRGEALSEVPFVGVDTPAYFDFRKFVSGVFREQIEREAATNPNIRGYVGTLTLRLEQAINDPRYQFLFEPKQFPNALASFLRYVLGVDPSASEANPEEPLPWKNHYSEQFRNPPGQHNITILDFSQLATDVLENATALIARLVLEFMQRVPSAERGRYPVVLVLEEAHRYIPAQTPLERQIRAREIFERIAKEGRKYGLSLVVASQRPSELSKTIMAQCNSFIVHRLQNPDDRDYFRSVVSDISRELLDQLPALPQQHALVVGDCIKLPMQVKVHAVDPKPNSRDPQFYTVWSDPESTPPDFEAICAKWEGAEVEGCDAVPGEPLPDMNSTKPAGEPASAANHIDH